MRGLIPWRELEGVLRMPEGLEGLMERFLGPPAESGPPLMRAWAPRVDVMETDQEVVVKADLPGMEPQDVEVEVEDGVLVLRGERKEERAETDKEVHRVERVMGRFYRALRLPPGADLERVTATGAHGVLTVTIPKKPEVVPRKVTVTPKA